MYKKMIHKIQLLALLMPVVLLTACGTAPAAVEEKTPPAVITAPGAYDSADTAIIVSVKEKQKKITFYNRIKQKNYTLQYDGATNFTDKYGSALSAGQLEEGKIVDITFLKGKKLLASLAVSGEGWEYSGVSQFEFSSDQGTLKLLEEVYNIRENTIVLSAGKQVELMDINARDILTIRGTGRDVYSIVVEEGHGYLRLKNEDYFIGGWLEIGKIIRRVEEDMLLAVPEGEYEVWLSNSGIEGVKEVTIKRNQETELDVGDLKKDDLIKYGTLIFTTEPAEARVYIDGKEIDITRSLRVEYGLHQIMAKAEGYDTVIQYLRINKESANVNIYLEKEKEPTVSGNALSPQKPEEGTISGNTTGDKQEKPSGDNKNENKNDGSDHKKEENTVSGNDTDVSSSGYKVSIEAPEGAEVYVDGNYVGIVPASFPKKSGNHEITIRKNGYLTRSYTIEVDKEQKNASYSFSDLTPIE